MDFNYLEALRHAGGSVINPYTMSETAKSSGISWTDVWAGATAVATTLLFLVGWGQIAAARHQAKGWQTLAACEKYEIDPVIHGALTALFQARNGEDPEFERDPKKYRAYILTILNYLDGIAIGIEQKLYVESIVWDHLQSIVSYYAKDYLNPQMASRVGYDLDNYRPTKALADRWAVRRTRFKDAWQFPLRWRRY